MSVNDYTLKINPFYYMTYAVNPDRTIPWNEIPDLPIAKELYYNTEILESLGNAKAELAKLQGRSIAIPNQGMLINTISIQEAKASSAIENIFTTDDELYKAFSNEKTERIQGAPKEILKYREALWKGHSITENKNQFDTDYFIEVFREIKETTDGIRPSFSQIIIRREGTGPKAGEVIYTPPRGEGVVESKIENLLSFMNDDETYKIDPIIKMAIGHFQFGAIHPFRDGNGRTGRIFNLNYLTAKGLLDSPILYLSKYIIDNKNDYYHFLSQVSQTGNWNDWILFMLRAVEETSRITYRKITDILSVKEQILKLIEEQTEIKKEESLINMIFTQPFTKVKHLTDEGLYAENTARKHLEKLCNLGILEKKTLEGHHYYLNIELYNILSN